MPILIPGGDGMYHIPNKLLKPDDWSNVLQSVRHFSDPIKILIIWLVVCHIFSALCHVNEESKCETIICDLLQQNPEQVAWDYFEM